MLHNKAVSFTFEPPMPPKERSMPENLWPVWSGLAVPLSVVAGAFLGMKLIGAYEVRANSVALIVLWGFTVAALALPVVIAIVGRCKVSAGELIGILFVGTLAEFVGCMLAAF